MSCSYERSSKTLNEAYYSDSDSDQFADLGLYSNGANLSRSRYLGDPSFSREDPEESMIVSQRLPPMKGVPYLPNRQPNYHDRPYYRPFNNYSSGGLRLEDFRNKPTSLVGRSDDEIFADLERVVNRSNDRNSRDDTPSLMSDDTSPTESSTPSVTSPPVSPGRHPSPPSHIEPQGYRRGYYSHNHGHKSPDSAENTLVSSTQHMRIEPTRNVAQARAPSHYPMQVESSFAQTKLLSPHASRVDHHPPMVATARSPAQERPPPCPYATQVELPRAIRANEPFRSLAPIPPPKPVTESQARVTESPRCMAPRPTPQPETQIEHPKAVAKAPARLRTLAPKTIETNTIEPSNTQNYSLQADKAEALNKVDTSRLDLLANSALGNDDDRDDEIAELGNEVTYLPALKRQKAQKLDKPPRPSPQKKRGRYECKLCSHIFTRNFDLTRHVRTIHETRPEDDILKRTCPCCGEVQSRGDSHRRHMAIVPASCERQAKILGKPPPPERSESFYAMCKARARPATPPTV